MYSPMQTIIISIIFSCLLVTVCAAQKHISDPSSTGIQNDNEALQMSPVNSEDFMNQEMMPADQVDESYYPGMHVRGLRSNGKPTFIRFGKRASPSFIRFGRK